MGCATSVEADGEVARDVDQRELVDSQIFVTPLKTSSLPFKDLGLITATYTQANTTGNNTYQSMVTRMAHGTEKVRAMALAKLRTKCKMMGGNAVLGVKFDIEVQGFCRLCVAHGSAVLMQIPQQQIQQQNKQQIVKTNYS